MHICIDDMWEYKFVDRLILQSGFDVEEHITTYYFKMAESQVQSSAFEILESYLVSNYSR